MSHPGTRPYNKPVIDERQLRHDLVLVYGEKSDHVAALDSILHRMWAAEDVAERVEWGATG